MFTKAAHCEKSSSTPGAEDDHLVRARIAHGLQERGHVGDVVGLARRRVAGKGGFDVTYLRRRSERRAVRLSPVDADLEFAVVMHSTLFQSSLLSPHAGCHHLSELLSNQKRLPLAEVAGYAERS